MALLTLLVTAVAGTVLGAWLVLAVQAALERRILLVAAGAVAAALVLAGWLTLRLTRLLSAPPPAVPEEPVAQPREPVAARPFAASPELARVGVSFGRMVDELERRNREVVRHRDQLQAELLEQARDVTVVKEAADRPAPPRPQAVRGSGQKPPAARPARRA